MKLVAGKANIDVRLDADEQLTFHTPDGDEYDVAAKEWGCYLTPSILGRLAHFGLRAALVSNGAGARRLAIVQTNRADEFLRDVAARGFMDARWLDLATMSTMMRTQNGKSQS